MELKQVDLNTLPAPMQMTVTSSSNFIEANTVKSTLPEIREKHIIPVFVRDNEPLISHAEFIESTYSVVESVFRNESIALPAVRVSHPIKGRIPEAKRKPADQLLEHEKTIYYERMAFAIEIPTIKDTVGGNELSLTIGGVKAYNQDNLYAKRGSDQNFKLFIGFKNKVCTNLCVWSDGSVANVKVRSLTELIDEIYSLVTTYNAMEHLTALDKFQHQGLTEQQFALMIGRCRMYQFLQPEKRKDITPLKINDAQINSIVSGYYRDGNFNSKSNGDIDLWKLYNLFTGANKSSYIDTFVDKGLNCYEFTESISQALDNKHSSWFLN
jgi:hypothetical protein